MNILVVHNLYKHKGGEDSVVESEVNLLQLNGHNVRLYKRTNTDIDKLSKIQMFMQTLWSTRTTIDIKGLLSSFRPDVIHVHNSFPLVSPSIYWVAYNKNIPVVQTLHNYRLICPQAMLLRQGKICEDCLGGLPWKGVIRGCYRNSILQSFALASMLILHRFLGTWQNKVARYISLNTFGRDKFISGGLDKDKITVKPNFTENVKIESYKREGYLFVGRLSIEKGINVLASAFKLLPGVNLTIIGSGELDTKLNGIDGVKMLGQLPREDLPTHMQQAKALIVPSICYETFGQVVIEAFANGLPVIASNIGVLPDLVKNKKNGLLFKHGNYHDLCDKIQYLENEFKLLKSMEIEARRSYEMHYTDKINYKLLMKIYNDVTNKSVVKR